jgi:hypothetical protein
MATHTCRFAWALAYNKHSLIDLNLSIPTLLQDLKIGTEILKPRWNIVFLRALIATYTN